MPSRLSTLVLDSGVGSKAATSINNYARERDYFTRLPTEILLSIFELAALRKRTPFPICFEQYPVWGCEEDDECYYGFGALTLVCRKFREVTKLLHRTVDITTPAAMSFFRSLWRQKSSAEYVRVLNVETKQDGIFFVGTEAYLEILQRLPNVKCLRIRDDSLGMGWPRMIAQTLPGLKHLHLASVSLDVQAVIEEFDFPCLEVLTLMKTHTATFTTLNLVYCGSTDENLLKQLLLWPKTLKTFSFYSHPKLDDDDWELDPPSLQPLLESIKSSLQTLVLAELSYQWELKPLLDLSDFQALYSFTLVTDGKMDGQPALLLSPTLKTFTLDCRERTHNWPGKISYSHEESLTKITDMVGITRATRNVPIVIVAEWVFGATPKCPHETFETLRADIQRRGITLKILSDEDGCGIVSRAIVSRN